MDKADLDCVAIEECVNVHMQQQTYMCLYSTNKVDSDYEAIEAYINHST
jgi:hypothetical protein